MACSEYPRPSDTWSISADFDPSSRDDRRSSVQHAPRRVQHGYSESTGHFTYDIGPIPENDPYRIQPRLTASRRPAGQASHGHSSEESHRKSDKSSSKRDKSHSGRSSSSSSSGSSRASSSRSAETREPTRSGRPSHHHAQPRTPTIERLATPELTPLSGGLRFCPCGCSDEYHEEEEAYRQGRSKMDGQIQCALRYISRN